MTIRPSAPNTGGGSGGSVDVNLPSVPSGQQPNIPNVPTISPGTENAFRNIGDTISGVGSEFANLIRPWNNPAATNDAARQRAEAEKQAALATEARKKADAARRNDNLSKMMDRTSSETKKASGLDSLFSPSVSKTTNIKPSVESNEQIKDVPMIEPEAIRPSKKSESTNELADALRPTEKERSRQQAKGERAKKRMSDKEIHNRKLKYQYQKEHPLSAFAQRIAPDKAGAARERWQNEMARRVENQLREPKREIKPPKFPTHTLDDDVRDIIFTEGFYSEGKEPDEILADLYKSSESISASQVAGENARRRKPNEEKFTTIEEFLDLLGEENISDLVEDDTNNFSLKYLYKNYLETGDIKGSKKDINDNIEFQTAEDIYEDNLIKQQDSMIDMILNPQTHLKIEGTTIEKLPSEENTYRLRIDPRAQASIVSIMNLYRCSISDVLSLVVLRSGLGIDSKGKIVKRDPEDFEFTIDEFVLICDEIRKSQKTYGHPLHIVAGSNLTIGGTRCFPIGYVPKSLAVSLTQDKHSVLHGRSKAVNSSDVAKLINDIRTDWLTNTQPNIIRNAHASQRSAINNMMRAVIATDSLDAKEWEIPEIINQTFDSILQEQQDAKAVGDEVQVAVAEQRRNTFEMYASRCFAKNKAGKGLVDSEGNFIPYRRNQWEDILRAAARWERFAGVVGNPPIVVSGMMEKAQGNIDTKFANWAYGHICHIGDDFKMTQYLKEMSKSKEATEALGMLQKLYNIGGADAVLAFGNSEFECTQRGMADFLDKYILSVDPDKRSSKFLTKMHEIDNWYRSLMEGQWMMRGADCKRFLEMALINNSNTANQGLPALNAADLEKLIQKDGIGKVLFNLSGTNAGYDAFLSMSNLNLGRKSPLSFAVEHALQKFGITEFLITTSFETYLTYGVNLMQLYLPMTNTISYLVVNGLASIEPNGKISTSLGNFGREAAQYQLGGTDSFDLFDKDTHKLLSKEDRILDGLKKNIIYDLAKLGNTALIALFWYCLIDVLGQGDPDDNGDIYNWLEYRIGVKDDNGFIPGLNEMADEAGLNDDQGQLIIPAWWMNDLSCWGLPAGTALNVFRRHPEDPHRAWKVFLSGCCSMLEGSSIMDAIEFVRRPEEYIDMINRSADEGDYMKPDNWESFMRMEAIGVFDDFTRKATPAVLRDYLFPRNVKDTMIVGQTALDHSAAYIYDTANYTPEEARKGNHKVAVDSYEEQRLRQMAKNNPVLAVLLNITRNGYIFDNGKSEKTGYLFEEMPLSKMKDPARTAWCEKFDHDLDNPLLQKEENKDILEQQKKDSYDQIIQECSQWSSVDEALAHGFMIPAEERLNAISMAYREINSYKMDYYMRSAAGEYPDWTSSNLAYEEMKKRVDDKYKFIQTWLQNEDIPWSDEGYVKLISDTEKQYYYKNGDPATYLGWIMNPGQVERRYVPLGNSKTSLLPFTRVHTENRGYNFETINNWYEENVTDTERVHDFLEGKEVPYGRFAGHLANNVIFGGQDDFVPSDQEVEQHIPFGEPTTISQRAWIPTNDHVEDYVITDDQIKRYGLAGIFGLRSDGTYGTEGKAKDIMDITADDVAKADGQPTSKEWKELLQGLWDEQKKAKAAASYYGSGGSTYRYGGGGGYRSGGSGGNSYNPKIYSSSHSVNAPRAASMYTKQPYSASQSSYLRPGFSTKGSREAYKRSEL